CSELCLLFFCYCVVSLVCFIRCIIPFSFFFFFNDPATTEIYTLSLHDALPISAAADVAGGNAAALGDDTGGELFAAHFAREEPRSEEHTSELQSRENLVCRLLLEKKKKKKQKKRTEKKKNTQRAEEHHQVQDIQ